MCRCTRIQCVTHTPICEKHLRKTLTKQPMKPLGTSGSRKMKWLSNLAVLTTEVRSRSCRRSLLSITAPSHALFMVGPVWCQSPHVCFYSALCGFLFLCCCFLFFCSLILVGSSPYPLCFSPAQLRSAIAFFYLRNAIKYKDPPSVGVIAVALCLLDTSIGKHTFFC